MALISTRLTITPSSFSKDLMAVLVACLEAGAKAAAEAMREAAIAIFMVTNFAVGSLEL